MALVVTKTDEARTQGQFRDTKRVTGTIAFDSSYPTNGELLQNSQLGLDTVTGVLVYPTSGYVFEYVSSTKKIKAYQDNAVAAAAPLGEVANTTDLSALTAVSFEALGY
jgi:hypothetical protein